MKKNIALAGLLLISGVGLSQKMKFESSTVVFESTATKETITANNSGAIGIIDFDSKKFAVRVPIIKFSFKNKMMQSHFNENYMDTEDYPNASYKGILKGDINLKKDGVYKVATSGTMTVHGTEKKIEVPAEVVVKGKEINLIAKLDIKPKEYGIKIPKSMANNIAEVINVSIDASLAEKK